MKKLFLIAGIFSLMSITLLNAQVTIGKNQQPDPSAVLDLQSNDKLGLLLPRVALTDTVLADPLAANVAGMFVYNTNTSADGKVVEGIYFNDGHRWWLANGGGAAGPWQVSETTDIATSNDQNIYQMGQVTIGSDTLLPITMLNVVSTDKGIMIPRMTQAQRDAIDVSDAMTANSLVVYNTDEDCYNYFSRTDGDWKSLCGGVARALFTVTDGCSDITVNGVYTEGTTLNASNYLSINVDVTKAGNYTFSANTDNGYGFSTQGTFLTTGPQTISVPGQGKPIASSQTPGDLLTFTSSGASVDCNTLTVIVLPPTASFSLSCGSAQFAGAYVKGRPLTAANTVTLNVDVSDIYTGSSWTVFSNTVNGVSFSGHGMFTTTGLQPITLQGSGTPTSTSPIVLTFTTNSRDGAATCTATLQPAIPPMTVLALGTTSNAGYNVFSATADTRKMLMDPKNFGTQDNSTVKFGDGSNTWNVDPISGVPSAANIITALTRTTPPDIVITGIGWEGVINEALSNAFVTYLQKGGVLIMYCETVNAGNARLLNAIIGQGMGQTSLTTLQNGNTSGARYLFPASLATDPVVNGPFGDLTGLWWGEDASSTATVTGMDAVQVSQIVVYTTAAGTVAGAGNPTMFRHRTLNFIWSGDGGFNSSYDHTSTTICPFLIQQTAPYIPVPKPTFTGGNSGAGAGPVYNSVFTANAMAWALNQALTVGINRKNYQ